APRAASPPRRRAGSRTDVASFDHLVGAREQRGRDSQAESLGGPPIDNKLEFCGLLNRQVSGIGALEDARNVVDAHLAKKVQDIGAVAHQPAAERPQTSVIYGRNFMTSRLQQNFVAVIKQIWSHADDERPSTELDQSREGRLDFAVTARFQ